MASQIERETVISAKITILMTALVLKNWRDNGQALDTVVTCLQQLWCHRILLWCRHIGRYSVSYGIYRLASIQRGRELGPWEHSLYQSDWWVRVFGSSSLIYISSDHLYIWTIHIHGMHIQTPPLQAQENGLKTIIIFFKDKFFWITNYTI